ncbi:hypothetical protein RJ55_01736 [Drechmeria coniospora]|nr:hypothetical protein RJ55_01736 [Drechmeria coniospora]
MHIGSPSSKAKITALILVLIVSALAIASAVVPRYGSNGNAIDDTKAIQGSHVVLKPSYIMKSPCGSTATEARQRGCKFDIISFCWLPTECYDGELSRDFDAMRTWEWFRDFNKTEPLSHKQIMTGEFTGLYVNWEYHVRHCTAMWQKMHRAILGQGKRAIDSYIGELPHTHHCGEMLLERGAAFEDINTIILVKFPDCGIA